MKQIITTAALALLLAGCAANSKDFDWAPVTFEQDNYCAIARKRTWSLGDTQQTITEARRENAKFDRICIKPKQVAAN